MDPNLIVGLIAAGATIIAAIIGARAARHANEEKNKGNGSSVQKPAVSGPIETKDGGKTPVQTSAPSTDSLVAEHSEERKKFEMGGVLHVLRERLSRRIAEQLDPSARRFESMQAVENGCRELVSTIRQDKFLPELVIGWKDPENEYQGSQTLASLISKELDIPSRILNMQEINEKREVVEDSLWFKKIKRAIIVDDACYSGSTLKEIQKELLAVNSRADIRFAVLSTLDPKQLPHLYHVSINKTEELLFPWGWSRLIVGFYDIYKLFGISDRHAVWHETTAWGTSLTLARNFTGNVRLISIDAKKEKQVRVNRESDIFLYILSGAANIQIGDKSGTFKKEQYIFIPRSIGYEITASKPVEILELSSGIKKTTK